jgi:uncharacterized protein (TIGR02246 family)
VDSGFAAYPGVRRTLLAVVVLRQEDIMRDRRRAVVAALLGLATLLMAPETAWTQEDAIRKLAGEDYDKAMAAGDVSAKMRLYTADAVLMPPDGPVVSGQDAIRLWHEKFFKKGTSPGVSKVDEVQVFGEWGFARGTFSGTIPPRPYERQLVRSHRRPWLRLPHRSLSRYRAQ